MADWFDVDIDVKSVFKVRSENVTFDEHRRAWSKFEYIEHLRQIHNEEPKNENNQLDIFKSSKCEYYKNHDEMYLKVLEDKQNGIFKTYSACNGKEHIKYNVPDFKGNVFDKVVGICPEFTSRETLMPYDNSFKEEEEIK